MAAAVDTNLSVTCSTEYKDYTYNEKHDIWALVSLKAPCQDEEDSEDQRAPIDVVAVIDKSGSMAGEKLKLTKRTLEFVLTQLSPKDRLSIITYDTNVYVDFKLMKMTADNKETALNKIRKIKDGSSTNLCGGLMKGLCQIIDRDADTKNEVASVLLFTDGLANAGISDADGIIAAMKDPKRFDGPSQQPNQRQQHMRGPPPPPSKSSEKDIPPPPSESTPADASVYTFGFGQDHNEVMLKQISDAGNGMYYFIETEDKIGESFAHCLGGLMSTVAQGIQLCVNMEPNVAIKEVHCTRPFEKNGVQSVKVNIGDLQSEENRDIVLELTIEALAEPCNPTPQPLLKANVDYFNVVTKNMETAVGSLAALRPEKQGAHDDANINPVVTKEKYRVNMTKAMKDADIKANEGDYDGAKVLLSSHIDKMKKVKSGIQAYHKDEDLLEVFDVMTADLEECRTNAASSSVWQMKGKKMQMNKMQAYECQRSSNVNDKAFKTKKKGRAVEKSKKFFAEEEE